MSRIVEPEAQAQAQAPSNPVARILSTYGRVALPVGKTRFEKERKKREWNEGDRIGGERTCSFKLHGFRG